MPPIFSRELVQPEIVGECLNRQNRTSPCEAACPAGMPIQKVHASIVENRLDQAYAHILSRNPFSGVTGRVCPHPCETECNRRELDEPVSIRGLERLVSDTVDVSRTTAPRKRPDTGKRIAIVGAGPAGLTAAYYSALFGHRVTVYEAASTLGGVARLGIPDFRLPKHVVDREVGAILALGIEIKTNTMVGQDVILDELMADNDACLIAVGTWKEKRLSIPGAETAISGLSFLKSVNLGERPGLGRNVVILGGGGVAFDCAFTARRLGSENVHLICVEGEDCLPAASEDVLQSRRENITLHAGHLASSVTIEGSRPTGVEYFRISGFSFDECGRLSFQCDHPETLILKADTVIMAVGQTLDLTVLGGRQDIALGPRGNIAVDPDGMFTAVRGLFAAGDAASGPSTVARAIGDGRRAAVSMHEFLTPEYAGKDFQVFMDASGEIEFRELPAPVEVHVVEFGEILNIDHYEKKRRLETVSHSESAGDLSFQEINRGLPGTGEAVSEAGRCFHCGHCQICGKCVEDCPGYVLAMTEDGPKVVYPDECWHCGNCRISCPSSAVSYKFPISMMV